jgi:hypothetical protein
MDADWLRKMSLNNAKVAMAQNHSSQSFQSPNVVNEMVHPNNHSSQQMKGWYNGLEKMWRLFNSMVEHRVEVEWLIPSSLGDAEWEFYSVTTGDIANYLGSKWDKGYWSDRDRLSLNYIRGLYLLNKDWVVGMTPITKIEGWTGN